MSNFCSFVVIVTDSNNKLVPFDFDKMPLTKAFANKIDAAAYADAIKKEWARQRTIAPVDNFGTDYLVTIWRLSVDAKYYNLDEYQELPPCDAADWPKRITALVKHLEYHTFSLGAWGNKCHAKKDCPLTAPGGYSFVK